MLRRSHLALLPLAVLSFATGCHSAYIDATIRNGNPAPISVFEVDYPSASFGQSNLASAAEFHYRFKVLGNGPTKVLWTDAARHDHTVAGPALHEGDEGTLIIILSGDTAVWQFTSRR